jgi:hypothetical protein
VGVNLPGQCEGLAQRTLTFGGRKDEEVDSNEKAAISVDFQTNV